MNKLKKMMHPGRKNHIPPEKMMQIDRKGKKRCVVCGEWSRRGIQAWYTQARDNTTTKFNTTTTCTYLVD
jgi:hypothetical protein